MFGKMRSYLMPGFLSLIITLLVSQALPATAQTLSQGPVPSRITAPIDNAIRANIARSTHPMAQAQFDRGPVDPSTPMERMLFVLGGSEEQENQLRTFLDSQQTKGSPDYHKWLTPEAFGQRFGPSLQDIQQATGWLQQQGFNVTSVAKSGRWIEFSGTAQQVQAAFQTQMRNYKVEGKMHTANASDISIPSALSPVVRGVSLHNFFSKPMHRNLGAARRTQDGTYVRVNPDGTFSGGQHALAPGDFAIIYNLPGAFNGSGQTIALVGRSNIDPVDISDFHKFFGPTGPINVILNGPDPGLVQGDQDEATLDVEWSSGVASGATVDLVVSAVNESTFTDGVDLSAAYIVDNNFAGVMSTSFGQCEQTMGVAENAFWNALWEQAAAEGISAFVSAGDNGAAGCDDPNSSMATHPAAVSGLASTPFNTAVGGTEFDESLAPGGDATFWNTTNTATLVSVKGYIPEMVWNESCSVASCGLANANLFAGSGGQSTIYATPSWQSSTTIPGLNFTHRAIPDVSLAAAGGHDGFLTCDTESCELTPTQFAVFGGTSVSSPSFAGIMAIIDQKLNSRQGLANYVLYALAKNENFSNCNSATRTNPAILSPSTCVFNDTTTGNNNVPGLAGFNAVTGYDLATGLGSVDATNLANAWATIAGGFQGSATNLVVNSPNLVSGTLQITHGQAVNLTATVTRTGSTGSPTGTVSIGTSIQGPQAGGQVVIGAGPLSSGSFTGTFNNFPGGTYTLTAHYPGDGVFGSSTGPNTPIPVVVMPENSTTTLTASSTSIAYGGLLDLSTVVAPAANTSPPDAFPSGTITIKDGGSIFGTLSLNSSGQAELFNCSTPAPTTAPCLTVGSHPIQVVYAGDSGFNGSNTAPAAVTITVTKAASVGTLTTPTTGQSGASVSVSAQVNAAGPILPTGTVQFFQGTTSLSPPITLTVGNPSTASTQITLPASGNQTFTAQYSGDSTYGAATFGPNVIVVTSPFAFTAVSTAATVAAGQPATFNLTLTNTNFNGAVNFTCMGATGGSTCTVSPNPANLTPTTASVPVTVTVNNTASAGLRPAPFKTLPFVFAASMVGLLVGTRKKPRKAVLAVLAFALIVGVGSCGGGGGSSNIVIKQPTVANLTVIGSNGSISTSINLTLTITH